MGKLLLVAVAPHEESTLSAAAGPEDCRAVETTDLESDMQGDPDTVVVGSRAPSPVSAAQRVHRADRLCGVVLLTTPETDAEVRRSAMYAPDVPASLLILESDSPELAGRVGEVLEVSRLRRAHHETLAAIPQPDTAPTPHTLAPASLGALLDHAPFGVLVGDLDARLVT